MKKILVILVFISSGLLAQQHPIAFGTAQDMQYVKNQLSNNLLLKESFDQIKKEVDASLDKDIDVPVPKDPAGGYTHNQHKNNYLLMFNAGVLYQITKDEKYAKLVKSIFIKYAALNPTLKDHPQATSTSPGRLFWQALNDANWLVYSGLAFDCVHNYLTPEERKNIAAGAFKPLIDYFTRDLRTWFDLIHNHAVWACAGVGIVGIATDNQEYLNLALYGSGKDGKAGFLAQMNGLFSPDGYYNEGPYYTRYAVLPFFLFANAINRVKPELKIFQYRNQILKKALDVALQQTNLNGIFFSYNDALKDKSYVSNELVNAVDIAWQNYGYDTSYLTICKAQNKVILNRGGVDISKALLAQKGKTLSFPYYSAEYTDGADGKKGGVSILRSGKGNNLTTMVFKYSSHGLSHGHYDKLNIQLFDNGNEILQDYGAVRYLNVEQKWGGRYLPETNSYAQQTIAHNTITVDEQSHFNGLEKVSELYHPDRLFGSISSKKLKVVSVEDARAYEGVRLCRTEYMIMLPESSKPLIVDVFKAASDSVHQYDLPFNYLGTVIQTSFKYDTHSNSLTTLGNKNGYQHIWKEASALRSNPFAQFTFLNQRTFYTISTLSTDSLDIFFTRIGANDPKFNLRRDPSYILRVKNKEQTFINVIEAHGSFDPIAEVTTQSYSSVSSVSTLQNDSLYTIVEIEINKKKLQIMQSNKNFDTKSKHSISLKGQSFNWIGPYAVKYDNTVIN